MRDIIQVVFEIQVSEEMEDSKVTSMKLLKTGNDLNFGFVGMWLVDVEGFKMECDDELPKEIGRYRFKADWNDEKEMIEHIYDIEKIEEVVA